MNPMCIILLCFMLFENHVSKSEQSERNMNDIPYIIPFVKLSYGKTSRPIIVRNLGYGHVFVQNTIAENNFNNPEHLRLDIGGTVLNNKTENKQNTTQYILHGSPAVDKLANNSAELNQLKLNNHAKIMQNTTTFEDENVNNEEIQFRENNNEDQLNKAKDRNDSETNTPSSSNLMNELPHNPFTNISSTYRDQLSTVKINDLPQTLVLQPNSTLSPDTCHQACLEKLNATKLSSNQFYILEVGSELTLTCELNKSTSFEMENMIWKFHHDTVPTSDCSLTAQNTIASCEGFNSEIYLNSNNSIHKESLVLKNLQPNNSGTYMCEVKITCCQGVNEHTMAIELVRNEVIIWMKSYFMDLIIIGSVAAGLGLIFAGVSFLLVRRQHQEECMDRQKVMEKRPATVLHLPLINDEDNDSFNSYFEDDII